VGDQDHPPSDIYGIPWDTRTVPDYRTLNQCCCDDNKGTNNFNGTTVGLCGQLQAFSAVHGFLFLPISPTFTDRCTLKQRLERRIVPLLNSLAFMLIFFSNESDVPLSHGLPVPSANIDTKKLKDGWHELDGMIVDQDNFTTSAMPIRFYVDNTSNQPPAISIVQPSNGDKVSGVISLRAIASDSDGTVRRFNFKLMGELRSQPLL